MNYTKHYNRLIERAKNRNLTIYTEKHHIIPKCLNGGDEKSNIVKLTPEEHYLAHLLLIKMYPKNVPLVLAASMMICNSNNQDRSKNKLYGWLRRKHANAMKQMQAGERNSQYGTCWISNLKLQKSIKISTEMLDTYISAGWIKKRIIDFKKYNEKIQQKKNALLEKEELKKRKLKLLSIELQPLYDRYLNGESIRDISNDYDYSHVQLFKNFKLLYGK